MVQADAVALVPPSVGVIERPVSSGARRVLQGLRPVRDADLIHGLDVDLPIGASCPTVTTVHDLAVFDVPWAFSRYRGEGERRIVARSVNRADEIIAVSNFTAERIEHHFGLSATVVPLAPRSQQGRADPERRAEVRVRYGLPDRFVFQLASIEPRKDVQLLAAACEQLGVPLVLAGGHDARAAIPSTAQYLGYVDADDVDPLLDVADIVAYISSYEGFGLPPIEAMARGSAVVASAAGALPEVAADGAELVPVGDLGALVIAIGELWNDGDRRADLQRRAREQAATLSWQATGEATLDVYRSLGVSA